MAYYPPSCQKPRIFLILSNGKDICETLAWSAAQDDLSGSTGLSNASLEDLSAFFLIIGKEKDIVCQVGNGALFESYEQPNEGSIPLKLVVYVETRGSWYWYYAKQGMGVHIMSDLCYFGEEETNSLALEHVSLSIRGNLYCMGLGTSRQSTMRGDADGYV